MSKKLYIPIPSPSESLVTKDGVPTEALSRLLRDLQTNVNPFLAGFSSGTFQTVAGSATQTISVPDTAATSLAFVQVKTPGAGNRYVLSAACTTNAITVQMSADPGNDHTLSWLITSLPS